MFRAIALTLRGLMFRAIALTLRGLMFRAHASRRACVRSRSSQIRQCSGRGSQHGRRVAQEPGSIMQDYIG
jgi:hypothetical protein